LRRILHDLRDPVGAFVIHLSMLDDRGLDEDVQRHVDAMLGAVQRMVGALADLTAQFELERGKSTPLAILNRDRSDGIAR
jgi:hypothetical protein